MRMWRSIFAASLIVALCVSVSAFYTGSDVIELTPANFDAAVLQGPDVWIVEFYAEWCTFSC